MRCSGRKSQSKTLGAASNTLSQSHKIRIFSPKNNILFVVNFLACITNLTSWRSRRFPRAGRLQRRRYIILIKKNWTLLPATRRLNLSPCMMLVNDRKRWRKMQRTHYFLSGIRPSSKTELNLKLSNKRETKCLYWADARNPVIDSETLHFSRT